jgi:hypothetical protein
MAPQRAAGLAALREQQEQQQFQLQLQQEQDEEVDQEPQQPYLHLSEQELQQELDAQEQRRALRQQQQQLPTLLEDAAAGASPIYVLVPIPSSSSSRWGDALAPPLAGMASRVGEELAELAVPQCGPLLLTNAPAIFKAADVLLDAPTEGYDRLALQLELVKPAGSDHAVLVARNLSRVVRGRLEAATMHVSGQPMLPPHGAAVQLAAGDTLRLGATGMTLLVQERQQLQPQPAALAALQRYCGAYTTQQLGLTLPVQQAEQQLAQLPPPQLPYQQQRQGDRLAAATEAAELAAAALAAADALEPQLRTISRLARTEPRAAERQLAQLAVDHPAAAGPWFLWAQVASSSKRPAMARDLYRAAAVCQQRHLLLQATADAGAEEVAAAAMLQRQRQQAALAAASEAAAAAAAAEASMSDDEAAFGSSSSSVYPAAPKAALPAAAAASVAAAVTAAAAASSGSSDGAAAASVRFRLASRLVQILRGWGKLEWDARLFGPARRLWRLAANEAFRFPYEVSAAAGGAVLHCWATAEYERDNMLNARVVVSEALRKCPKDAAVSAAC